MGDVVEAQVLYACPQGRLRLLWPAREIDRLSTPGEIVLLSWRVRGGPQARPRSDLVEILGVDANGQAVGRLDLRRKPRP